MYMNENRDNPGFLFCHFARTYNSSEHVIAYKIVVCVNRFQKAKAIKAILRISIIFSKSI